MSLLDKYRVDVENEDGSWWLRLRLNVGTVDNPLWVIAFHLHGFRLAQWRLTPSLDDGLFVLPVFWFKTLKERVMIAVQLAVQVVAEYVGRDAETRRLADELTVLAMEAFRQALVEYEEAK